MTGIYSAPASTEMSRDKRFLFIVRNPSIYTRVIGQNLSNTDEIGLGFVSVFLQQSLYPKTNPRLCHPLSENRGHVCRQPGIELPDSDTTSICLSTHLEKMRHKIKLIVECPCVSARAIVQIFRIPILYLKMEIRLNHHLPVDRDLVTRKPDSYLPD